MTRTNTPASRCQNHDVFTLQACETPQEIERYFQRTIKDEPFGEHDETRDACNARALEIASSVRRGNMLPIRLDKGRGNSRRYELNGEVYKTGTWGNGPGYRYAMSYFESWYEKKLRQAGLRSKRKIELIISWYQTGYLWRSLRYLAR